MKDKPLKALMKVLEMVTVDGELASTALSPGQIEIIYYLVYKPHMRLHIMCSTQYGKSLAVAIACVILTAMMGERVCVVAPTNEKFKIIMRYYREIMTLNGSKSWRSMLEKESKAERLMMEETARRYTLKNGGVMYGISAQAGNSAKGIEAAMGEGAQNIILDEASLTPDVIEATIFRMIAGQGDKGFYCKIGNPFYRNHFLKSYEDKGYYKIDIDYKRAIKEGRYTQDFIEEARKKPLFNVLFENKFPGEGMYDEGMFLNLIPKTRITVRPPVGIPFMGQKILGIDPAGEGKDIAVCCIRDKFQAQIVGKLATSNPREITQLALTLIDKFKPIIDRDIVVDAFGVGADVGKEFALATKGKMDIYTVLLGNKPRGEEEYNNRFFRRQDNEHDQGDDIYMNLRALAYFRMRSWLMAGGVLVDEDGDKCAWLEEILSIKYRRSLQGNVLQIMSKKERADRGLMSPNMADALMLTFLREIDVNPQTPEEVEAVERRNMNTDYLGRPFDSTLSL